MQKQKEFPDEFSPKRQGTIYGNLYAYKMFTRPMVQQLFGKYSFRKKSGPKHHESVQKTLEIFALNESLTTWGMAKLSYHANEKIRIQEKSYRRIIRGRMTRGRHLPGLLDAGLVVLDGKNNVKIPADKYRLSLHGILYCLDVLDLTDSEIDILAIKYSKILPFVFGKWHTIKSVIPHPENLLKSLAGGLFMDNHNLADTVSYPMFELMTYIHIKYKNYYEQINESDLADQITYWYYTALLAQLLIKDQTHASSSGIEPWNTLLDDSEINKKYSEFVNECLDYFYNRLDSIKILFPHT